MNPPETAEKAAAVDLGGILQLPWHTTEKLPENEDEKPGFDPLTENSRQKEHPRGIQQVFCQRRAGNQSDQRAYAEKIKPFEINV